MGPSDRHHMVLGIDQSFYIQRGVDMRAQLAEKLPGSIMAPV
jgi:hypothetical protein